MDIDFTKKGTVKISITGYIDEAVEEFTKDVTTSMVRTAAEHLLEINQNFKRLDEKSEVLCYIGLLQKKLLFVSKHVRPDTYPTYHHIPDDESVRTRQR